MYAAGAAHPLKEPCQGVMRLLDREPSAFVTDAEVLQEIVHRYRSVGRWEQGHRVLVRFAEAIENRIDPVYPGDVMRAADLADAYPALSARDLLHAAVMHRLGTDRIVSTDTSFDAIHGIQRLDPALVSDWQDIVLSPDT